AMASGGLSVAHTLWNHAARRLHTRGKPGGPDGELRRRSSPSDGSARVTPTTSKARQALKTPRAAAIVGIVFSVVLATSQVLIRLAIAATPEETGVWRSDSAHRTFLGVALYLVPFAGIAFLWFIGVIRDRMGAQEDRFFATVFLGSGLLFVAML